jgi:elongation factor Tu
MTQQMKRRQFLRTFGASTAVLLGVACGVADISAVGAQAGPANRRVLAAELPARSGSGAPEVRQAGPAAFNVATLGHVDHGKTTLTSAITKVLALGGFTPPIGAADFSPYEQIHNAPKESVLGVTAAIKRVEYRIGSHQYVHVDCPQHLDYVKNIIRGTPRLDVAILVVSAADGPMPQTREHILLARRVEIPAMVVYLNKVDLNDDLELLDLVELEVRGLLIRFGFDPNEVPMVRGSALQALNSFSQNVRAPEYKSIVELVSALDTGFPRPTPSIDRPFLLPIEDIFAIKGRGTVVTGQVERGQVKAGDTVEIVGLRDTRSTTVTAVEMVQSMLDVGRPGDNVGCVLRGVDQDEIERGQVLAKPGSIGPRPRFGAEVYLLSTDEGGRQTSIASGGSQQFYVRTTDVTGTIQFPEMTMPGDNVQMQIELTKPVAVEKGLRFTIREQGRTVGVGVVTELFA